MKKMVVLGLLLLAGCSSPAVAESSDPVFTGPTDLRSGTETLYLGDLHRYGYPLITDPEIRVHVIKLGRLVCTAWDGGSTDPDVFFAMTDGGATSEQAAMVMTASRDHLCPGSSPQG